MLYYIFILKGSDNFILEPPKTHTEEFVEFENFALKL